MESRGSVDRRCARARARSNRLESFVFTRTRSALINDNNRAGRGDSSDHSFDRPICRRSACRALVNRRGRSLSLSLSRRSRCHAVSLTLRRPDKNHARSLNCVLYAATTRRGRLASGESCFKYNIRDAMPSICYDDDSANERETVGGIIVTVSMPHRFPYGPRALPLSFPSFFFYSVRSFVRHASHRHRRSADRSVLLLRSRVLRSRLCARRYRPVAAAAVFKSDDSP